eukprot:515619-Pelagomonas_calceolata.AAC.5
MRRLAGQYIRMYSRNSGELENNRANWKRMVPTRSPKKRPCAGWTPPPKPKRIACTWRACRISHINEEKDSIEAACLITT